MPQTEVLKPLLKNVAKEQKYIDPVIKINTFSAEGGNYTSLLFTVTIKDARHEDLDLFAKIANLNKKLREQLDFDFFLREKFAYTELLETYKKIEDSHNFEDALRMRFPKLYGYSCEKLEEVIIFEDLGKQGYVVHDRFESINWDYAAMAVEELAKFHALSFAFKHEHPERFDEVYSKMSYHIVGQGMVAMWQEAAEKSLEAVDDKYREKLKDLIKEKGVRKLFGAYFEPLKHQVLCHGDYRPNNILYKMKGNKVDSLIPVDYQLIRQGSPVSDLLYFIFCGSDEEFRRKHYDNLIEHYYTILCRQLRKMNIEPEKVYSRADYDEELKVMLPLGLAVGIFLLPLMTVESENAPRIDTDSSGSGCLAVQPNDLYKYRLNGIINDYVRWGLL